MKKRTRTLLILLALALAIAVLPRLCATVEGAAPSGGQQTGPDLPLIDGEGAEDAQEEAADLPLIGEEDAPGQALTEPTQLPVPSAEPTSAPAEPEEAAIDEDGEYTSRDDVALYLYTYGRLPGNFITKKQPEPPKCADKSNPRSTRHDNNIAQDSFSWGKIAFRGRTSFRPANRESVRTEFDISAPLLATQEKQNPRLPMEVLNSTRVRTFLQIFEDSRPGILPSRGNRPNRRPNA